MKPLTSRQNRLVNIMWYDEEPINEMNEALENLGVTCLYALVSSYDNCIEG